MLIELDITFMKNVYVKLRENFYALARLYENIKYFKSFSYEE